MDIQLRTLDLVAPSGYKYTIREQNGADEDILSNPVDSKDLTNLAKFIAAIVVSTDFTKSGKLTVEQSRAIPALDRNYILIKNRMFSMGDTVEFDYTFNDGTSYGFEQDLNELVFEDYSKAPSEEELDSKPFALPYYPGDCDSEGHIKTKDIEFSLSSGKLLTIDLLNGESERYIINLPESKRTRNSELIAKNLKLNVNGKYERVTNFSCFSVRDMKEIRDFVSAIDPVFTSNIEVENPNNPSEKGIVGIMGVPSFFASPIRSFSSIY